MKDQLKNLQIDPLREITFEAVLKYLTSCSSLERRLMSNAVTLVKLILVMPATNATSERCFSALRRVKTYLRGTMRQDRLNYAMMLHSHKNRTDNLNLINVANDFVTEKNDHRLNVFGRFKMSDVVKIRH